MPSSVMLSCLALEVAQPGRSIGENLLIISTHILGRLQRAKAAGKLIHVENPCCSGDCFTDRWPENFAAQDLLIADMQLLLRQMAVLFDESRSFGERAKVLEEMFGESVAQQVIREYEHEIGSVIRSGNHLLGSAGGIVSAPSLRAARPATKPNTFYGTRWSGR